jgi:peptide/nickel transport system substrate-binding protein
MIARIALSAALLALGFACAGGAGAAETVKQPKHGGILEFAVDAEPANYDCDANISFAFLHPIAPHYSTLLKFDAANYPQVTGDLATSWSVSADKLTYTFKLHPGVLFQDGSKLTSADVKASYERIAHPPQGVISARQVNFASIADIETPDAETVVFHLRWPEAAMLANFASPWNCIYSAAKLKDDPLFPQKHVLGSGAFTFVEHVVGDHWTGKRFDHYFKPDRPYLDGYRADFTTEAKAVDGLEKGTIMAEFRSVTPQERDRLVESLGDKIVVMESPWINNILITFNTKRPPLGDARVRRALSLAIDRWGAADQLSNTTFLKYVGGVLRPGFAMATPESELVNLPGFSHDIEASRAEARRLLAEAGVKDLKLKLTNRTLASPYFAAAEFLADQWKQVGVTLSEERLDNKHWQAAMEEGNFDVSFDFVGDYFDDPTLQLTKFVSTDLSPVNYANSQDRFLDALYVGQAISTDMRQRTKIVRDFERHALTEAYAVPLLWWNRIVVTSAQVKGWSMTPTHFIEQDLTDVWLDR